LAPTGGELRPNDDPLLNDRRRRRRLDANLFRTIVDDDPFVSRAGRAREHEEGGTEEGTGYAATMSSVHTDSISNADANAAFGPRRGREMSPGARAIRASA
jgi:hypothetical protein